MFFIDTKFQGVAFPRCSLFFSRQLWFDIVVRGAKGFFHVLLKSRRERELLGKASISKETWNHSKASMISCHKGHKVVSIFKDWGLRCVFLNVVISYQKENG